jgi:DNA-binding CsgD family transcriptional regulator
VAKLPKLACRALLAAALSGHLSLTQLTEVADTATVEELVTGGLLIQEDELVRLAHPLLAVAARRQTPTSGQRELHLALAQVVQDETLRARHLALSAEAPDALLADTIAAAAAATARRGAAHDAAELAERALGLTPPEAAEYPDRVLTFAQSLVDVGELIRMGELLDPWISELPAGTFRARAHLLLGEARSLTEHEHHLELALADCGSDPALRAIALATKSRLLAVVRVERIGEADELAGQAHGLAQAADAGAQRHAIFSLAWARVLRGRPIDDLQQQLAALPRSPGHYEGSIERPAGVRLAFRGNVREARELFRRELALATERGEAMSGAVLRISQCEHELRSGDGREARRLLREWAESGAMEGVEAEYARCQASLAALVGRLDEMERWMAVAAEPTATGDPWDRWDELQLQRTRGLAALLSQDPERAAQELGAVWEHCRREGVTDPGAFPVAADLVEALVWLDRIDEALEVTRWLSDLATSQDHPWGLATAARCRAVIRLSSGYDEPAAVQLAATATRYGELGLDFDRARSLLWLGRQLRRARKRTQARRLLEQAGAEFDQLGLDGWARQARAEVDLLGSATVAGALTPAQRRVAELAAAGFSNKEIARRLFVAVHTVEVHLTNAYAKVGVRSRAQLARYLANEADPDSDPPTVAD